MNAVVSRPRFHVIAIVAIAALVVTGFARTFYLRYWFDTPPLTRLLYLHGLMFTCWACGKAVVLEDGAQE